MGTTHSVGDRVRDRVQLRDPEKDAGRAVVVGVTDDRADEHGIEALGGTPVSEAAGDWPHRPVDGYDPDADRVVLVAFAASLDHTYGTTWRDWDPDRLAEKARSHPGVPTYAYHSRRLAAAGGESADRGAALSRVP